MKKRTQILSLLTGGAVLMTAAYASATCAPFSPYHMMTMNMSGGQPLDLTTVSTATGLKSYNLAFIIDAGSCKPAWDGTYTTASGWGQSTTTKMRAANIAYYISFGGADGNDISKKCSVTQLTAAYQQIINTYQPNGLDFDIENGTANVTNIMSALKTIHASNPNVKFSFTLPVMPNGLDSSGKSVVSQAKAAGLSFMVDIMAMDYDSSDSGDMGQYAIQAANSTFSYLKTLYPQSTTAQLWQMIQVTPMIGVNDVTDEIFTLANTDALTNFANTNGLGGLSMWSLDRDKPCGGTTPNDSCSSGNVQTYNYEFTQHFLACSTPVQQCLPPANITYKVNSSKTAVTFNWTQPANSLPITTYQVSNWLNQPMWTGTALTFTDATLPGTSGVYNYFFYSNCGTSQSSGVAIDVNDIK